MTETVRVKFRFKIQFRKESRHLMRLYSEKFSALMSQCSSAVFTQADYEDLPEIRKYVTKTTLVSDLADVLQQAKVEVRKMILDTAPVFNESPTDLKSFILLAAGVRSSHFKRMQHVA